MSEVNKDIISGHDKNYMPKKVQVIPTSKTQEAYYDMLVSQPKPFNRRKGSLVTPDVINRLNLH